MSFSLVALALGALYFVGAEVWNVVSDRIDARRCQR